MRRLSWFVGAVTLVASAAYVAIYLYRWEWHRALFVAVVFVAVELAMATGLVLRQLTATSARPVTGAPDPRVLAQIRASRPERDHFAWLARDLTRTHVFVTALLGGGVLLSAGTWVLDRIAYRTVGPVVDRSLAVRLAALSLPDALVADDDELLATELPYRDEPDLRLLLGPIRRRR